MDIYENALKRIDCDQKCKPNCLSIIGPQGENGGVLGFADFYALMPPDNAATVAPGTDVSFHKMVQIVVLVSHE